MKRIFAKDNPGLKRANRAAILDLFLQHKRISRRKLGELAGLTPPTVSSIIKELMGAGIVKDVGLLEPPEPRPGRPPQLLELDPASRLVLAIHLSPSDPLLGLVDLQGQFVASEPVPYALAATASVENLVTIIHQARAFLTTQQVPEGQLLGVGVGASNLPWAAIPQAEILQREFPCPVIVGNNVHAMALGEYVFGFNRAVDTMVFVYIGWGIASGIIIDGKVHRGATGRAGQIGHLRVTDQEVPCPCGNTGCLAALASGSAIAARTCEFFPDLVGKDDITIVTHVIQSAQEGNSAARAILGRAAHYLGLGLANVVCTVNPQLVVIGGYLDRAYSLLLEPVREIVFRRSPSGSMEGVEFQSSKLGDRVALVGIATMVLMELFYSPRFALPTDR